MSTPNIIGLTGGIASGKSTVGREFEALGITVIDADQVARDVVAPGRPELQRIAEQFGANMLDEAGALNRRRMREHVFSDPGARSALEAILHPAIRKALQEQAASAPGPYVIWMVPILIEMGLHEVVAQVVVVDVDVDTQLSRLCARDDMTEAGARAMIAAQVSRDQRLAAANHVIDNRGDPGDLRKQVNNIHEQLQALASA